MAVIRAGAFQNFAASDKELLQAAAQILDVPPERLELRRKGKTAAVQRVKGNTIMKFLKWPSVENAYRKKFIAVFLDEFPELTQVEYVITEKLHGANLQLAFAPGEPMCVGTRKRFLGKDVLGNDEKFYNVHNVLQRDDYQEICAALEQTAVIYPIRLFGELFGGKVQKGVDYGREQRILFFGLMIGDELQPFSALEQLTVDIPILQSYLVPVLSVEKALQDAIDFDCNLITRAGMLRQDNIMEGIVIQPYRRVYRNAGGHTFLLKKKNEAFKEKQKVKRTPTPEDSEAARLNMEFRAYLTSARLQAVFSKYGEIEEPHQIGEYIRYMLADAKQDFLKDWGDAFDALDEKGQKQVLNVGSAVAKMLQEAL